MVWSKSARIKGHQSMQSKLMNHDLHYNYMKHMRGHQTSQKQKYAMPKYAQITTETQSIHVRMKCAFGRPCKGVFYTYMIDIQNGKITSGKRL